MAYASHLYRDPMEVCAARQAREQRQPKPERKPEQRRQRVQNSPLPEFPRRWLEAIAPEPWSPARQAAEALFASGREPEELPSASRQAAEALFEPA